MNCLPKEEAGLHCRRQGTSPHQSLPPLALFSPPPPPVLKWVGQRPQTLKTPVGRVSGMGFGEGRGATAAKPFQRVTAARQTPGQAAVETQPGKEEADRLGRG